MAKNILKEAIADAKAVREVALANAKAALEEAFTPKLQSMLSAKLSEELNDDEEIEENVAEEDTIEEIDDIDEMVGMDDKEELDEEIDLEEILAELELEEGEEAEEIIDDNEDDEDVVDEGYQEKIHAQATDIQNVGYKVTNIQEDQDFDLDALLEEINNLDELCEDCDEEDETEINEFDRYGNVSKGKKLSDTLKDLVQNATSVEDFKAKAKEAGAHDETIENWSRFVKVDESFNRPSGSTGSVSGPAGLVPLEGESFEEYKQRVPNSPWIKWFGADPGRIKANFAEGASMYEELNETKKALKTVRTELNEVNLLNSKLLYVNRIFKANTLDDTQKLRVVETLDKAESAKEAKLIYETIKDTFTISKKKKTTPKRSIKEGLGMASKAAGTSTAPKKAVLNESNEMVARMQKLANITIKQ